MTPIIVLYVLGIFLALEGLDAMTKDDLESPTHGQIIFASLIWPIPAALIMMGVIAGGLDKFFLQGK